MKVKIQIELEIDSLTESFLLEQEYTDYHIANWGEVEQSILDKVNKAKGKFFKSLDKQMLYYRVLV